MVGGAPSARNTLGSMLIGTAISFMLHGVTNCQMIWYFSTQSGGSSKIMKALIFFIWLGETLNCVFMFHATLHSFFAPAVAYAQTHNNPCGDWNTMAQAITSAMCTFCVESFFVTRIWRLSDTKLTMLAFIPHVAGGAFGIAQMIRSFRVNCESGVTNLNPVLVFGAFGCTLLGDGIVAMTMCYMLYVRSSGFTRNANTMKIVRGLILWSISTGLLTWFISVLFLLSYRDFLPGAYAIFYIRSGLYANTVLAQLNARTRFRTMAEATIPFSIDLDTRSSGQPVNYESQSVEPKAE